MAKTAELARNSSAPPERRGHPRRKTDDVTYFDLLDRQNGGLVLNLSETGLLLQSALKFTGEDVSRLRFRLPASDRWIEARARLVWFGETGKEVGAQFVELSEDARARIKEWVTIGGLPESSAAIPGERIVSQQTTHEPSSAPPASPPREVSAPGTVPVQQNDWPPPSFAQPRREPSLPWSGLAKVLGLIAIVAAVFVGLEYSQRVPQSLMLGRMKQVWNSALTRAKAVESTAANALKHSAAAHPQAQSPVPTPNPLQGGAVPASPTAGESASVTSTPKDKGATLGKMDTQTLSFGSVTTGEKTTAIRSQTQQRAQSAPQPRGAALSAHSDVSDSSHDAILVGAPPVGAPSSRVILEGEPVSASSFVAITERRSIFVPGSYDRTEPLQLGKLASHVNPVYPDDALAREIEGTVRVRAFIGLSGQVQSVRLLSGSAALAPAAINAIRQWRYSPTLLNGQAIESQADINVFFRLH